MTLEKNTKIEIPDFDFWHHHYFGWPKIMEFLKKNTDVNSSKPSVLFDPCLVNTFIQFREKHRPVIEKYEKHPWVGVSHHHPRDSRIHLRLETILGNEKNKLAFENCKGIFVFTQTQKEEYSSMSELGDVPISLMYHPMEKYDEDCFFNLESLSYKLEVDPLPINTLCCVGDHSRVFKKFSRCRISRKKAVLLETPRHWRGPKPEKIRNKELRGCIRYDYRFSNEDYDKILCNNIQFVEFMHPCASNYVLECIVRATPMLVSKNKEIVEYMGKDYPMYMKGPHKHWNSRLNDFTLLKETHEYLLNHPFKEKFTMQNFLHDFVNSEVYKKL
jgi:hypothetical protein